MKTLEQFSQKPESIPTITSWYLTDLAESRGRQELFTRQAPQRLKALREHALVESAVSSNRIEGVMIDQDRVRPVVLGKSLLRDRDEEEVRGYRNALKLIHEKWASIPVSNETICQFHRLARGKIWDAGQFKEKDGDIIEKYPNGRERIRFKTVSASKTPVFINRLIDLWSICVKEKWVHPLAALAGFNLDFLCIHPFRDGNGRVSRLLLLLQCYQLGYEVGRFISLERLIEENKERYYETLEQSSQFWQQGRHDPWPYINFVLFILKSAYREFEQRVGETRIPRGAKTELIESAVNAFPGEFTLSSVERACPGVSRDMVRKVLRQLQKKGQVDCVGRGPGARWRKKGNIS